MSDSNQFGSAGTALADPPAEETLAGTKGGPKPVVLVAIVVGVLAVAAAAYFLLFSGGGDDTATSGAVPKGSVSAPAGSSAPSASAKPVTSTAPQQVTSGGRDPFAPLVVAAAPSASGAPSAGSTAGSGTGSSGATVPSGLTESVTLTKVGLSPTSVDVTVNGKKYTGQKVGVVFGTYFSLVAATGSSSATLNFGDSSFSVVVGKTVTLHT
jgi:hypothetical protein